MAFGSSCVPMVAKFLMMSFKPSPNEESAAQLKMEACVKEIYSWMACNKLKLNRDKTELYTPNIAHVLV